MIQPNESLRLGCVKYLNARPLIHGWPGPVEFDHPAVLCRKLAAGELDLALVSSFEFLRQPDYRIIADVAVGCDGPVYSVFLAHKGELASVEEIVLDPASLTSVNLLRCLLAEGGFQPRLVPPQAGDENEITATRARLLIGDQAINFREEHADAFLYWDLGAAWKQLTGLPFVFALWLVRPEVENPEPLAKLLRARRDENLASLDSLIASHKEFTPEFCRAYFRDYLRFGFADREKEGLLKFRSLCQRHGILPPGDSLLRLI